MDIKIGKKYRQRDGHIAEIKEIHIGLAYPFRGKVCLSDGIILDRSWDFFGRCYGDKESEFDLVEELPVEVSSASAISMDKQYRTKEGKEVRIYSTDAGGSYPVHGAIFESETEGWTIVSWTKEGKHVASENNPRHLVEIKPRVQREVWLNVYRDNRQVVHRTKELANQCADTRTDRIACVKVVIDCEEGEGLE